MNQFYLFWHFNILVTVEQHSLALIGYLAEKIQCSIRVNCGVVITGGDEYRQVNFMGLL